MTAWTGPGAYDIPEDTYHADLLVPGGSLSYSGAKKLLPPSCPALFKYDRDHGQAPKAAYDFGHAVHSLVLGSGAPLRVIDAADWRSNVAKGERDAAYALGEVPLLKSDYAVVRAAAEAVAAHPIAGPLFGQEGVAEQSLYWTTDVDMGHYAERVWRRCRPDWQTRLPDGRPLGVDLKTCVSAEPHAISKAVWNFRYDMQHAGYVDGMRAAHGYDVEPAFLFVFVEKTAPHLVTVCELDGDAIATGRAANDRALRIYADCMSSDVWPGYVDDIPLITLPPWA